MFIDDETISCMADAAHIFLSQEEKRKIAEEFDFLQQSFDALSKLNIQEVEPTVHPITDKNVFREDTVWESLSVDKVLENAPGKDNGFFLVPRIIEE